MQNVWLWGDEPEYFLARQSNFLKIIASLPVVTNRNATNYKPTSCPFYISIAMVIRKSTNSVFILKFWVLASIFLYI